MNEICISQPNTWMWCIIVLLSKCDPNPSNTEQIHNCVLYERMLPERCSVLFGTNIQKLIILLSQGLKQNERRSPWHQQSGLGCTEGRKRGASVGKDVWAHERMCKAPLCTLHPKTTTIIIRIIQVTFKLSSKVIEK